MPQLYYDALLCLTFVIVLTAMLKVGRSAFKSSKDSFRQIILGLSFLTVFSLVHLGASAEVFAGYFFFEDIVTVQIVEATFIAGGLIFLLVGVGSWLPTLRDSRKARQTTIEHYNCLREINLRVNEAVSFDTALHETLNCLNEFTGTSRLAGFKYSQKSDTLFLVGSTGFMADKPQGFARIELSDTDLKNTLLESPVARDIGHNTIFDHGRQPDIVLPIKWRNRLHGSLFCWTGENEIDSEYIDFMKAVGETLGNHCGYLISSESSRQYRSQIDTYTELSRLCNQVTTIQQLTKPLFRMLQKSLGAEFLTIADMDNSGENMFRYSIGASGRMLLEKRVSRATRGTDMEKVFKAGKSLMTEDMREHENYQDEEGLILSCGMRSKIVSPIMSGRKVLAALVVGHSSPAYFTPLHQKHLDIINNIIASVVEKERLQESVEVKEEQMIRLQMMEKDLISEKPLDSIFEDACDMLTRRMKCTMARVSLIDNDNKNLVSQSWRTIRETGQKVNKSDSIPLSLLPWHRLAVENNKPMLINQADMDSKMQAQESAQTLLPNISSAMLVPIQLNDSVRGVISIGEVRNWNRRTFNAADLVLAKDVATKCSVALRMKQLELDKDRYRPFAGVSSDSASEPLKMFKTELKSPLTSILGAVELLKTKEGADETFTSRYHDMIMRSAEKIQLLSEKEDWTQEAETKSYEYDIEPEQVIG